MAINSENGLQRDTLQTILNNIHMIKHLILICLFSLNTKGHAQGQISKYRVIDAKTFKPIPYSTIRSSDYKHGTFANLEGACEITEEFKDSLYVSSIGYQSKKIRRKDIIEKTIYLDPFAVELPSATITPRQFLKEETLGVINAKKSIIWTSGGYGDEFAQKIVFPDTNKIYRIKTITIAAERFDPLIPMLIHIYDSSPQGLPGKDILLSKIVISKKHFHKSKRKLIIDISSEEIFLNQLECFVAVEWLPVPNKHTALPSSAIILTDDLSSQLTYSRAFFYNKEKWGVAPRGPGQIRPSNTVISVQVEVLQ